MKAVLPEAASYKNSFKVLSFKAPLIPEYLLALVETATTAGNPLPPAFNKLSNLPWAPPSDHRYLNGLS